jgi:hypothetical protein
MTAQLDHIDSTKDKRNDAEMFEDVGPEKPIPTAEKYDRFGARKYSFVHIDIKSPLLTLSRREDRSQGNRSREEA